MLRIQPIVALVCLGLICLCGLGEAPLADHLPENTMLYAGWAGRSLTFDGSVSGQLLQESEVAQLYAAVGCILEQRFPAGESREMLACGWQLGQIAWQHPIAVALVPLGPVEGPPPRVAAVVLIDLGKDKDAFDAHLSEMLQSLGDGTVAAEEVEAGTTLKTLQLPGKITLQLGYMGNVFFAATDQDVAKELIQVVPGESLETSQKFVATRQDVIGENEQLALYLDVISLKRSLPRMLHADVPMDVAGHNGQPGLLQRILNAYGLGELSAVVGSVRIVDYGMYTKLRLLSPAPHRGLLMPFAGAALDEDDLAGVPEDADFLAAIRLSPEAAYAELRRAMREYDPAAETYLLRIIEHLQQHLGVSITDDILASLGDRWVLSSAASQGGFLTGTVLSVSLKDSEKLKAALEKFEACLTGHPAPTTAPTTAASTEKSPPANAGATRGRHAGIEIRKMQAGATEIHYLSLDRENEMPLCPAWAIHKDTFYVAGWPQVIVSTVENQTQGLKTLAQEPRFRELRARVGEKPSAIYYVNTPSILRQTYPIQLLLGAALVDKLSETSGVRPGTLWPMPLGKLQKYIWPEVGAVFADERGITFEAYGSAPPLAPAVPVVAIALPALARSREAAVEAVAYSDLCTITQSCLLYAEDHAGSLPESLRGSELQPYLEGRFHQDRYRRLMEASVLVASGSLTDSQVPSNVILIYRKPGPRDRFVLAGFCDGHMERILRQQFQSRLEDSKQQLQDSRDKKPKAAEGI